MLRDKFEIIVGFSVTFVFLGLIWLLYSLYAEVCLQPCLLNPNCDDYFTLFILTMALAASLGLIFVNGIVKNHRKKLYDRYAQAGTRGLEKQGIEK